MLDAASSDIQNVLDIINNVEGWLTQNEAEFLFLNAKNCSGKGVIVEIGSWFGRSTICLAKGSESSNNVPIYAIDPHITSTGEPNNSLEGFEQNISRYKVNHLVTHIIEKSQVFARDFDKKIEFIFIDGFHQYDFVKQDYEYYFPKVIENGIIAIHDTTTWEGPRQLAKEIAANDNNFKVIGIIDSIFYGMKVPCLSESEKAENIEIAGKL